MSMLAKTWVLVSTRVIRPANHPLATIIAGLQHVRCGSLADISERTRDVRFTPESGHAERPALTSVKCQWRTSRPHPMS